MPSARRSGKPFNDAYRYVDWLLTVPLLLIELILVMQLPEGESGPKMWKCGVFSGLMVAIGYPGEIGNDPSARLGYCIAALVPFMYVLYELPAREGRLGDSISILHISVSKGRHPFRSCVSAF